MFNIGGGEMLVILLLALLVLGPERLPKAMGQVGRAVAQMRRLSSGFQDEIRRAMDPIEAPFRPGEETLRGPVPAITDEVRVVSTAEGAPATAEGADEPPVTLDKADEPVALAEADDGVAVDPATQALVVDDTPDAAEADRAPRGTVTPLRPRVEDGDADRATG